MVFLFCMPNLSFATQNQSSTGVWMEGEAMPTARHGLGVASYDDKIFVIGGGPHTGLTVSDQNEIYYLNKD